MNDKIKIESIEDAERWINILHRRSCRDRESITALEWEQPRRRKFFQRRSSGV